MATADLVLAGLTPRHGGSPPPISTRPIPRTYCATCAGSMTTCSRSWSSGTTRPRSALALGLLDHKDKDRDKILRRGFPTCALGIYRLEIADWADVGGECAVLSDLLTPPFEVG